MKEADKDFLERQLVKLGDMMGDGLHLEPGGRWISREYGRILKALGILPKRKKKNNAQSINERMAERVKEVKCQSCGGKLAQTRNGSMRGQCLDCGQRYQLIKRKR